MLLRKIQNHLPLFGKFRTFWSNGKLLGCEKRHLRLVCDSPGSNVLLIVWKFIFYKQEVKEDQKALLGQAQNSMKAVLAVQKVFMALQVY